MNQITFQYEVRLLIEVLFEKGLINQPTYLAIIRNMDTNTKKQAHTADRK